jgi:hypothetical protein
VGPTLHALSPLFPSSLGHVWARRTSPGPAPRFSVGSLPALNLTFTWPSGSLPYHLQARAAAFFLLYVLYRILLPDPVRSALVRETVAIHRCQFIQDTKYDTPLRLSALMILYFYPLYIMVIKILSSILISSAPIHLLYHSLSTVRSTCHFI